MLPAAPMFVQSRGRRRPRNGICPRISLAGMCDKTDPAATPLGLLDPPKSLIAGIPESSGKCENGACPIRLMLGPPSLRASGQPCRPLSSFTTTSPELTPWMSHKGNGVATAPAPPPWGGHDDVRPDALRRRAAKEHLARATTLSAGRQHVRSRLRCVRANPSRKVHAD